MENILNDVDVISRLLIYKIAMAILFRYLIV